jgi:hypothetical protein
VLGTQVTREETARRTIVKDPAYVMAQMGHTNPAMMLGPYSKVMNASEGDRERLRQPVDGGYLAVDGSGGDLATVPGSDGV